MSMMKRDDWVAQSVGKVNGTTLNHPAFREKVEKIEADIHETHQRFTRTAIIVGRQLRNHNAQ